MTCAALVNVYVKLSVPVAPAFGVYVYDPSALTTAVPFVACVNSEVLNPAVSGS